LAERSRLITAGAAAATLGEKLIDLGRDLLDD
jgi:hypothetical protein